MKVNIISETAFSVKGHGVHTAFIECADMMKKIGLEVVTNSGEQSDIVHVHTIGPYALIKCLRNRGRLVITAHVIPDSFVGSIVGAKFWLPAARTYLKYFYKLADAILAVSPDVKNELEKMGIDKKKIFFIPNSVNPEKFKRDEKKRKQIREKLHIPNEAFIAMNTGQIQPRKGIASFIETARQLPNMTFVWIGGMPFKKLAADHVAMEKLMKNAPKNVIFPGIVPLEDMPSYYNAGDVLFFPSYQENFPFSILEAAASSLPIILRDIDIYKPIFGDNYIKGTDETFAKLLKKLHEDKNFYEDAVAKAKKIADQYSSTHIAKKVLEIYENITSK